MTVTFVIINIAVYVIELIAYTSTNINSGVVRHFLSLHPDGIAHGYVWQFFTFQFLHALPWPWHLALNCFGLYFFGREIEENLGRRTFVQLYLLSGVLGGLLHLILIWVVPGYPVTALVGASAGVFGLVAAYATMFPERPLTLLLFFVLPVTLRAKYLLWGGALFAVIGTFLGATSSSRVAHDAHLGGIIVGYCYLRWGIHAESLLLSRRTRKQRARPRELVKVSGGQAWSRPKPQRIEPGPEEFISREVDPILDKISAQGIQSLTPEERRILEAARSRMEKR